MPCSATSARSTPEGSPRGRLGGPGHPRRPDPAERHPGADPRPPRHRLRGQGPAPLPLLSRHAPGELNPDGAKVFTDRTGSVVTFVGIVAGSVNDSPTDDASSEYYAFLINRGLANGTGPFPGRPNIKFDALVAVAVTPAGTRASSGSGHRRVTPLTSDQITLGVDNVHVTLPTTTFYPAGVTPTVRPTANFIGLDTPLGAATYTNITGFASEFRNFPISLGPIRHPVHV